jgi:hypothetical protein
VGFGGSDVIKKTMGMEYIGIVLCAFGGVGAVASFVVGKLSDRLGKMIFVIVGSLAHGTFFAFFLFLQLFSSIEWLHQHSYVLFIMSGTLLARGPFLNDDGGGDDELCHAGILGLGDACWNTFVSVMMSSFFTDKTGMHMPTLRHTSCHCRWRDGADPANSCRAGLLQLSVLDGSGLRDELRLGLLPGRPVPHQGKAVPPTHPAHVLFVREDDHSLQCIILVNVMVLATICVVVLNFLVSPLDRDPHEVTTLEERPTIVITNNKNHPRVIRFKE